MPIAACTNPEGANWPSYYGIEAQWPSNLSPTVAGGDASTLKNPDSIWQAIQDGKPVVISTTVPVRGDEGRPENLPGAHAFFAKGFDGDGNLILANPWGLPQPDAVMSKEHLLHPYRRLQAAARHRFLRTGTPEPSTVTLTVIQLQGTGARCDHRLLRLFQQDHFNLQ